MLHGTEYVLSAVEKMAIVFSLFAPQCRCGMAIFHVIDELRSERKFSSIGNVSVWKEEWAVVRRNAVDEIVATLP